MSDTKPYRFVGRYAIFNDGATIEFKKFGQAELLTDDQARLALEARIPIVPAEVFDDLGIPRDVAPRLEDRDKASAAAEHFRKQRLTPTLPAALKEISDNA